MYASLKGKPILLSRSWDPFSAHKINKFLCIVIFDYINKGERRERLPA